MQLKEAEAIRLSPFTAARSTSSGQLPGAESQTGDGKQKLTGQRKHILHRILHAQRSARAASLGPGRPQRPAHVPGRVDRCAPPQHTGAGASAPVSPSLTRTAATGGAGAAATGWIRLALGSDDRSGLAGGGREGGDRGRGVGAGAGVVAAEQVLRSGVQGARGQAGLRGGGNGLLGQGALTRSGLGPAAALVRVSLHSRSEERVCVGCEHRTRARP